MELRDYLRIVRRRWLLITTIALVVVGIAAAVTFQTTPQYSSSTRLFVSTTASESSDAYTGGLFSAQRVTSYADLARGRELASRVIDREDLDLTPQQLARKVQTKVVPDTVLLEITVTDTDPEVAQQLAAALAEELIAFVDELETPPGRTQAPIKATVTDPATLDTNPVSPQPVRNLGLAAILGLLLGLVVAVVRDLLDTSVKSRTDIDVATDGAAVLGTIPFDSATAKKPLVTSLDTHAPRAEAFRVLRTNLQYMDVDRECTVFAVSSSVPAEGKTTTSANLAIAMAQGGSRVVLVEGDLRRGHLVDMIGVERAVGLTTVLVGQVEIAEAVQETSVANLWVLTGGRVPPNPAELLQSKAMDDVLGRLRRHFDFVVIDCPPLLPVTDAALIATKADGVLLVTRHGKTTRDQLGHSVERIRAVGATLLGVVLNMTPTRDTGSYGYGYGGYEYAPSQGRHQRDAEPLDPVSDRR